MGIEKKSYDTFEVPVKPVIASSGESAGSGAPIGGYRTELYDFGSMDQACADWGNVVQSNLKIKPNGDRSPISRRGRSAQSRARGALGAAKGQC